MISIWYLSWSKSILTTKNRYIFYFWMLTCKSNFHYVVIKEKKLLLSIKKSQKLHFQLTSIPFQCWLLEMWYSKSMCSHYSVYRRYATNFQAVDLSVFLANDSLITCKVKRIWDLLQCLRMCMRLLNKGCLKIIELTFCSNKIVR